jgi:predicted nucleic acid-binding protein
MTVYLDVNCVIYLVEQNPVWWPRIAARVATIRSGGDRLAVSDFTRAECLVGPYRANDTSLLAKYASFFADPDIEVLSITAAACERGAQIRATYNFKIADAVHIGAAIEHRCDILLTNDLQLARCTDIAIEILA